MLACIQTPRKVARKLSFKSVSFFPACRWNALLSITTSSVELGGSVICEKQVRLLPKDVLSVSAQATQPWTQSPWWIWDLAATMEASFLSHWGVFQVGFCGRLYQRVLEPLSGHSHPPPYPAWHLQLKLPAQNHIRIYNVESLIGSEASLSAHACEERLHC